MELSFQSGFFPGEPATREIPANPVPRTSTERLEMLDPPEQAKSISLSNCPVFPTSVVSFNFFMSKVMILVGDTKMSISDMTVSTWTEA